jgi:hypothetical protein
MTLQTERWFYRWKESGKDQTSCRIHNSKCSAQLFDIIVVELHRQQMPETADQSICLVLNQQRGGTNKKV